MIKAYQAGKLAGKSPYRKQSGFNQYGALYVLQWPENPHGLLSPLKWLTWEYGKQDGMREAVQNVRVR